MDTQLQERMKAKIKECFRKGNRQFRSKAKLDKLTFSKALTSTAGLAGWNDTDGYYIKLSYNESMNDPEFIINETIPHEVAHIIGYWLAANGMPYGDTGHGSGWRTIALALGSSGSVTGKTRVKGTFPYRASDGEIVKLTRNQHNAIQNEFRVFRTANGGRLTASGYMGDTKKNAAK